MFKFALIALLTASCTPELGPTEDPILGCPAAFWKFELPLDDLDTSCPSVPTAIKLTVDDPCGMPTIDVLPTWDCQAWPDKPFVYCDHRLTEDFLLQLHIETWRIQYFVGACRYEFQ